jgi:hypothetical protein
MSDVRAHRRWTVDGSSRRRLLSFTGGWSSGLSFTLILHRRLVDVNEGETAPRECREEDS